MRIAIIARTMSSSTRVNERVAKRRRMFQLPSGRLCNWELYRPAGSCDKNLMRTCAEFARQVHTCQPYRATAPFDGRYSIESPRHRRCCLCDCGSAVLPVARFAVAYVLLRPEGKPSRRRLFGAAASSGLVVAQASACKSSSKVATTRQSTHPTPNAGFLDYIQTGNRIGCDMPAKRA